MATEKCATIRSHDRALLTKQLTSPPAALRWRTQLEKENVRIAGAGEITAAEIYRTLESTARVHIISVAAVAVRFPAESCPVARGGFVTPSPVPNKTTTSLR